MLKRMLAVLFMGALAAGAQAAELDWVERVYGDGRHNAFTDLVQWNGHYYLCFRHAETHSSLDGEIRLMRSKDMREWEPCGVIKTPGDDRDPHFTYAGDRLYVFFGTWDIVHKPGDQTPHRGCVRSYCAYTTDGASWSDVHGAYDPGFWLWRVSFHDGMFYSAAYTARRPTPDMRETRLLISEDGVNWNLISTVTRERMAGEADMRFEPDGSIWLISRTGDKDGGAMFTRSSPTRDFWTAANLGVLVHAPAIAEWNGRFFVAGRAREDGKYVTRMWEIVNPHGEPENVELREVITLPSEGDTSYPGLLPDPASLDGDTPALFISWYSQHEREEVGGGKHAACIYTGRVSLEK